MTHWWETEQGHDSGPPKVPDLQSRGPGSIPGEDTLTALEPDGTATGCNPIEVGSTPTGVSLSAGIHVGCMLEFDTRLDHGRSQDARPGTL